MKIVVCVKRTAGGELNPFDACAYEAALRVPDSEVILLSMGPEATEELLLSLTRLGAKEAYLLCDNAFAGADTLATAYTLSLAVKRLAPDLVICGRQTIDGDTAQTGPSLSVAAGLSLITNVMEIRETEGRLVCATRDLGVQTAAYPALITVERIHTLRFPSIRSQKGRVIKWSAEDIGADKNRCGLKGSPTRVLASFQNEEGKRKCQYVEAAALPDLIREGLGRETQRLKPAARSEHRLKKLWIVGEAPRGFAESVSDDITVVRWEDLAAGRSTDKVCEGNTAEVPAETSAKVCAETLAQQIREKQPAAVLFGSDAFSKAAAPQVAALLQTGLCADCTALETDGEQLYMYRPAFSGNVIAKIACVTRPQLATVRTPEAGGADVICALGKGAGNDVERIAEYVRQRNRAGGERWELAASRAAVDAEILPYSRQVGLTGKSVNPAVYIAVGISGAVHHIAGMKQSGLVIAVNPDKNAPIFEYADYGIIGNASEIFPD